jgi:hypothetical protein
MEMKEKRGGRVAQVVECLPSKCEALNSNPSATKNRNERIKISELKPHLKKT